MCRSHFFLYSSILSSMLVILILCVWSCLFCGRRGCSLPEVSIISFQPLQFFASARLSKASFLTHIKMWVEFRVWYNFKTVSVLTFLKIVLFIVPINCKNFANLNSTSFIRRLIKARSTLYMTLATSANLVCMRVTCTLIHKMKNKRLCNCMPYFTCVFVYTPYALQIYWR